MLWPPPPCTVAPSTRLRVCVYEAEGGGLPCGTKHKGMCMSIWGRGGWPALWHQAQGYVCMGRKGRGAFGLSLFPPECREP